MGDIGSGELSREELRRVARQLNLPGFGMDQQMALHDAHVLIIGCGGLGCPIIQQLAAAGVGEMTLIDDDVVDLTNIQRQVLFGADDVGRSKVELAAARARKLQPGIVVHERRERLDVGNAVELFGSVDLVLDGSDSFSTKYLCADAAEITGTPLVWGTVLRFHGDVAVWHSGPSADEARGVGLRDVFPHQLDGSAVPDCATAGVLGATTSVIGGLMATAAIGWITGIDRSVGWILSYDAFPGSTRHVQAVADPARALVTTLAPSYQDSCASDLAADADRAWASQLITSVAAGLVPLIDIREPHEVALASIDPRFFPIHLPMSQVSRSAQIEELVPRGRVVVTCGIGKRSAIFVDQYGPELARVGIELVSLPGGLREHPELLTEGDIL